ncbi:MAG: hypothetical protein H0T62_01420 [Parachlamydiaceae bacterium]|nr:hypothetical protein [Parachlamydiaceae bacterium]
MIIIDFDASATALTGYKDVDKLQTSLFTSTVFIMPVRFQANGIELFGFEDDPWSEAPVMCLATEVVEIVKELKSTIKENYIIIEGPGDIEFTMIDNENVKIDFYEGSEHIITTVKYDELLEALLKYSKKLRKFLWERVPELNDHPYWGPWLRGERD